LSADSVPKKKNMLNISGPKRKEGKEERFKKTHTKRFTFTKYFKVIKSRMMRWVGHAVSIREGKNVYRILVGEAERKITTSEN